MRRVTLLVAALCGSLVPFSFGGFVVSSFKTSVNQTLDRIDLYARNTGSDSGFGLIAVDMSAQVSAGVSLWNSTNAGNWTPINHTEVANRSQVRIDMADVASSSVFGKTPSANQPLSPTYGPLTVSLGNFGVQMQKPTGAVPAQNGNGALFAQLFVTKNYYATVSGFLGGSAGAKVPFNVTVGSVVDYSLFVESVTPNPVNVKFGPVVSGGAPFTATVQIGGASPNGNVSLALAEITSAVRDIVVTGGGMQSRTFTVTGVVDYSLNQQEVVLPFTATCPGILGPTTQGSIRLVVTPEPISLGLVAMTALVRRRR